MPILTVACACFACASVLNYLDEPMRERITEEVSPIPEWAMSVHRAIRARTKDELRDAIVLGLKCGVAVEDVAGGMGVTVEYVRAIGINMGLFKPQEMGKRERIIVALSKGQKRESIAVEVGTSVQYVRRIARELQAA